MGSSDIDQTGVAPPSGSPPPRPGWIKVLAIVVAVVVVVVLVKSFSGGMEHGPGRHLPGGGDPAGHTPPVQHDS